MAKKPVQFRFEENFHKAIHDISVETGSSVSEIVRNAISLYIAIYDRTKDSNARFFLKAETDKRSLPAHGGQVGAFAYCRHLNTLFVHPLDLQATQVHPESQLLLFPRQN